MIATEPLPEDTWAQIGLAGRPTFGDYRHLIIYGQRTADGRLAFGGRGAPYHYGSAVRPEFDRSPPVFRALRRSLAELFPALGEVRVTHAWGGPLGVPRDWCASAGLDRATGLGWAGGYVGDGVATTNLAGRTLADLVLGHDTELTRLPWVGHRSPSWEAEPLRWLGANAGLQAMSWADRRGDQHGAAVPAGPVRGPVPRRLNRPRPPLNPPARRAARSRCSRSPMTGPALLRPATGPSAGQGRPPATARNGRAGRRPWTRLATASRCSLQKLPEPGEGRHEFRRVDGAPATGQVIARSGGVSGHPGEAVVAGGDVDEAGAWLTPCWLSAPRAYSAGLIRPSRCPATWSASATTPEKIGVASLVPPMMYQAGVSTPGFRCPRRTGRPRRRR